MKIVNLTEHVLNIYSNERKLIAIVPAAGTVARVEERNELLRTADGIPIFRSRYGEPKGVPAPKPGVVYVVPAMVAAALRREDVLSPGPPVRDEDGDVVGCVGLRRHV